MALEGSVLSSEEFKTWGKSVVLFAHVTTRIKGRKDDDLLGKKGGRGFPHLVALDAEGNVTAKLSGGRDVAGFKTMMESGAKYTAIASKAEKSTDDKVFLFGHDIEMGNLKFEDAKKRAAEIGKVTDEQKKKMDAGLLGLEIQDAMPKGRGDTAGEMAAGKKFAEMYTAGREPTTDQLIQPFFILMMRYAETEKNADLFGKALGKLKAKFGDNPRAKGFFDAQDKKLEALKAAGEKKEDEGADEGDDEGGM
jgi:hypothetical protein